MCDGSSVLLVRAMVVVVAVVVQGDAVELFEWISNLAHGRGKTRIERYALDPGGSNIYALALLDITEVGCFDALTLVWDNGRLHVTQKCPLSGAEERRCLDI